VEAKEIRAIRTALKMTQEEFAQHIGFPLEKVIAWEQRKARPSRLARRAINNIAAAMGVEHNKR
jgi:DNA-binding transcriptional regulator YiaG